jgi:hypothetical protein
MRHLVNMSSGLLSPGAGDSFEPAIVIKPRSRLGGGRQMSRNDALDGM